MLSLQSSLLLAGAMALPSVLAQNYTLVQDYSGAKFFQGFNFFTQPDPTDGFVQFMSMAQSNDTGIAGIMTGGAADNAVYLGVETGNTTSSQGRNAIRVSSQQTFQHALMVADIAHMPTGCGTWPALWMLGQGPDPSTPAVWPAAGEIDIIEGVNNQVGNSMTLHTSAGIVVQNSSMTGQLVTSNCDVNAPNQSNNAGCGVVDSNPLSFGAPFNQAGGGIWLMEWLPNSIKIWCFGHDSAPADIMAGQPTSSAAWGTPHASFETGGDMDSHFQNMQIIIDTTFCGSWAGAVWNTSSACSSLAPTCEQYIAQNGDALTDAYWAINKLQIYQQQTPASKVRVRMGGAVIPSIAG